MSPLLSTAVLVGAQNRLLASYRKTSYRGVLSTILEPPPVQYERPCTIVVAEDSGIYEESLSQGLRHVTDQFGMSATQYTLPSSCASLEYALQDMSRDLSNIQGAVLVARGPWISWQAQFYLESLPLAGLVMIDPISFDDRNGLNQYQLFIEKRNLLSTTEHHLFTDFVDNWGHWTLRLEAGSVPMLVVNTIQRPAFKRFAEITAHRHADSEGVYGKVPVASLSQEGDSHVNDLLSVVCSWVDDVVI